MVDLRGSSYLSNNKVGDFHDDYLSEGESWRNLTMETSLGGVGFRMGKDLIGCVLLTSCDTKFPIPENGVEFVETPQ